MNPHREAMRPYRIPPLLMLCLMLPLLGLQWVLERIQGWREQIERRLYGESYWMRSRRHFPECSATLIWREKEATLSLIGEPHASGTRIYARFPRSPLAHNQATDGVLPALPLPNPVGVSVRSDGSVVYDTLYHASRSESASDLLREARILVASLRVAGECEEAMLAWLEAQGPGSDRHKVYRLLREHLRDALAVFRVQERMNHEAKEVTLS